MNKFVVQQHLIDVVFFPCRASLACRTEQQMTAKVPNPIDQMVGHNIRLLRLQKKLSQEEFAGELGLTFQQVQKYEKGSNRTSASRLVEMARILDVGILDLFAGIDGVKGESAINLARVLEDPKAIELLHVFADVKDSKLRSAIVGLVTQLASS